MRVTSHYAFDSCLSTFYEGYRLFLSNLPPSLNPTLAARVRRNVEDLVI